MNRHVRDTGPALLVVVLAVFVAVVTDPATSGPLLGALAVVAVAVYFGTVHVNAKKEQQP